MQLDSVTISHIRNLLSADLALHPRFNIFHGQNGGGKTSLLEALHVLVTSRSFRTARARQIITFDKDSFRVSALVSQKNPERPGILPIRLGIEKFRTGASKIRLAEKECESIAELAQILPIQLINSESYMLLVGHSEVRRQFLDWIMFHVEQSFYTTWQRFKRALRQRNAALKAAQLSYAYTNTSDIRIWDKELVESGEAIDALRQSVLKQLIPLFSEIMETFWGLKNEISLQYRRGWGDECSLSGALESSFEKDRAWGYTTAGPHRADLEWFVGGVAARNVLSRGQVKLFICALLMARGLFLYQKTGRHCVFLVDDLHSELDTVASALLVESLYALGGQVLVTSIERDFAEKLLRGREYSMFHVEHGNIKPDKIKKS